MNHYIKLELHNKMLFQMLNLLHYMIYSALLCRTVTVTVWNAASCTPPPPKAAVEVDWRTEWPQLFFYPFLWLLSSFLLLCLGRISECFHLLSCFAQQAMKAVRLWCNKANSHGGRKAALKRELWIEEQRLSELGVMIFHLKENGMAVSWDG